MGCGPVSLSDTFRNIQHVYCIYRKMTKGGEIAHRSEGPGALGEHWMWPSAAILGSMVLSLMGFPVPGVGLLSWMPMDSRTVSLSPHITTCVVHHAAAGAWEAH